MSANEVSGEQWAVGSGQERLTRRHGDGETRGRLAAVSSLSFEFRVKKQKASR